MSAAVRMHCDEGLNKKRRGYISAQLDAATVSCRGLTHLEKSGEEEEEERLHGRGCGCVCVGKRKKWPCDFTHPPTGPLCMQRDKGMATQDEFLQPPPQTSRSEGRNSSWLPVQRPYFLCHRLGYLGRSSLTELFQFLVRIWSVWDFVVVVVVVFINLILPYACMRDSLTPATRLHK